MAAINECGWIFEYASENLRAGKEVVFEAVNQDGGVLQRATTNLDAGKEVVFAAVKQDRSLWGHAHWCTRPLSCAQTGRWSWRRSKKMKQH